MINHYRISFYVNSFQPLGLVFFLTFLTMFYLLFNYFTNISVFVCVKIVVVVSGHRIEASLGITQCACQLV